MKFVVLDDTLVNENEVSIPLTDRGWRFGDGVFETIRLDHGLPWQWKLHMERLERGRLALRLPGYEFPLDTLARQLISANGILDGFIRIALTRDAKSAGYIPLIEHQKIRLIMETIPLAPYDNEAKKLKLSSCTKIPLSSLPVSVKTMQGVNSMLARWEAIESDCYDALLLTVDGYISETSSGNIFWIKDEHIYTPSEDCDILPGTVRSAIKRLSPWQIHEGKYRTPDLEKADHVFITNVALDALDISTIDGVANTFCESHTITKTLRELLVQDRKIHAGFF